MSAPDPRLVAFRALVSQRLGLALPDRFDRHLHRALYAASAAVGTGTGEATCAALEARSWTDPAWQAAIAAITVRETSFFRQRNWWNCIATDALGRIIAARRRDGTRRLRCLSIGCASGDEPYSLAMTIDRLLMGEPGWSVEIIGLDLCEAALAEARAGLFGERALREVPDGERPLWFSRVDRQTHLLAESVRARVDFRLFNLATSVEARERLPAADFVMCRNVLIHMEPSRQPATARFLRNQVRDGGVLVVAPVEATASWFAPMQAHTAAHAIFFSRDDAKAGLRASVSARPQPRAEATSPAVPPPSARLMGAMDEEGAARLNRARRLADLGLFEEARRLCEQALAVSPEADLLMALVCQALGDLPSAQAAAQRSLEAVPSSPAAHYVHAIVCLRTGRTEEARQALADAVRLIGEAHDSRPVARHLNIDVGEIRRAASRLGGVPPRGGAHGRVH
ncbi:CheR family methyltransferase [Aquabacter sp. CN5-332]|uniref:CheR family methyltransferase n=1 Tax=Aquabacter sp. CN5-332 TaxID=3156608 RepID=UPI0032B53C69